MARRDWPACQLSCDAFTACNESFRAEMNSESCVPCRLSRGTLPDSEAAWLVFAHATGGSTARVVCPMHMKDVVEDVEDVAQTRILVHVCL